MPIIINFFTLLIFILFYFINPARREPLNPINVSIFFFTLFVVSDILVSADADNLEAYCTGSKIDHCNLYYFLLSTLLNNFVYITILLGLYFGIHMRRLNFLSLIFPGGRSNRIGLWLGVSSIAVGLFFLSKILVESGGFFQFWLNMETRSIVLQSLGYQLLLYEFFVTIGTLISFVALKEKKLLSYLVILIGVALIGALASRGAVAKYLFTVLIVMFMYWNLDRLKLFTVRNILILVFLFVVLIGGYLMRSPEYFSNGYFKVKNIQDDAFSILAEQVVGRFWRNERGMISLAYFDRNQYFLGTSYTSLIYAPVPRSIWPDKPPVEPGKYTLGMTAGDKITPPMPSHTLPNEALPPGVWENYWNFGLLGLTFAAFFSGFFVALVYKSYVRRWTLTSSFVYSKLIYFGPVLFSTTGVVEILTLSAALYLFAGFTLILSSFLYVFRFFYPFAPLRR